MPRRCMGRLAAALICVLTVVLTSACGSGEEPTDNEPDGGGSPVTVRLGFSAWPGWFPWQVAQEQGLFARNGVSVTLKWFDNYTDSINSLTAGTLDGNSQTLNDTITSVSGGAKQTVVLVNDNSTGNDQIVAASGINGVAGLKGRKVAVEQGTVDHYLLLLALARAGLHEQDVELVPMPTAEAAHAFVDGKVDAVGAFAPFTTTALERSGSTVVASSKDFPGAIPDALAFDAGFVKEHKQQVQAIVQTWFDTLAWIKANPEKAIDTMSKRAGVSVSDYKTYDAGTTIFTREQNLTAFAPGSNPVNLEHQADAIANFLVSTKLVDAKPSMKGLLDAQFVKAATG